MRPPALRERVTAPTGEGALSWADKHNEATGRDPPWDQSDQWAMTNKKNRNGDLLYCHVALWYGIAQSPWHNQDICRIHDMLPDLCFERTTTCVGVVNLTFASGTFYRRGVSFLSGVVSKSVPLLLCVSPYHQAMRQFKTLILAIRLVKSKPVYLQKTTKCSTPPFHSTEVSKSNLDSYRCFFLL